MTHQHPGRPTVAAALAAVAAGGLLSACGPGSPAAGNATVTVTPTVTAAPPPSDTTSPTRKAPTSDVLGRSFDFGVVTKVSTVAGVAVLELDRWTWKGMADAQLAKDGVPTAPFKGAVPYANQNANLTYTIPVADGARILFSHCIATDQPLQTKSVDPAALTGLGDRENTVLVQIDSSGRATSIKNVPGCPG